jgi:beta-glucosidase-like glycosyl hydrolase
MFASFQAVHGFARVQVNGKDYHVSATSFPMSIGMASSFNRSLWTEVGAVVGREARGAANANLYHTNALTFWAPNINIARDR